MLTFSGRTSRKNKINYMRDLCKKLGLLLLLAVFWPAGIMYSSPFGTQPNHSSESAQQERKLTGVVNDQFGPVAGATVVVKGSTIGTTTDMDGNFTLANVPEGATIVISFMGYVDQEIKYQNQASISVTLEEDSKVLGEVVVTALGIKKEKRALSYAMNELKAAELQTVPTQSLGSSLYGKAPGVRIASTAAGPMGGTKIQIRGVNSISGSTRPLIVLNGVPIYDNDSSWDGRERNQTQSGSALNDINPDDIESMSILKGANAAALYGSRATNGVILITTKKGKKDSGLGIEVNTSYTTDRIAYLPEYQNVFGQGTKGFFDEKDGKKIPQYGTYRSFGPRMDGTEVLWWDGKMRPFSPQPDNYKDLFQNGFTNMNSVSISNGNEFANMRLSYSNTNYEGFLKNMEQTKHNFNVAGNIKLSDWLSFDVNITFNRTENQNTAPRIDRVSNYPIPRSEISQLYKDHYKNADGYYLTDEIGQIASYNKDNILNYMLWQQNENRYTSAKDRFMANISANIKIINPLNLRLTIGTDRLRDLKQDKEMFKKYSAPADMGSTEGLYRKTNEDYTKRFYEAMLTFNQALNSDFDLSLVAAVSAEDTKESKNVWESNGLIYNGMFSTSNVKKLPSIGTYSGLGYNKSELLSSVRSSAQLAYKHYLYFDVTASNDWSSRLPKGSNSFFYPSVGLGFVFTDAFKLPDWLTYGKLRASYAIVGNSTPNIYFANNAYKVEYFSDEVLTNTFSDEVPPMTMKPEKTYSWEFGLELKAFNGRVGMDFAYFNNETRNQILSLDIPISTGAKKLKTNAGTVGNHGIEIQLTGTPIQTKDFSWDATVNVSYTQNKLKSFIEGLDVYNIGSPWSAANFVAEPGHATYTVMMRKWKRDSKGRMIVKDGAYVQESDYTYAGEAMPKWLGGFSTTLRYKDFSLTANLDAQFGGKIISFTNNYLNSSGAGKGSLFGRDEEYGGLAYYIEKGTNKKIRLDSHTAQVPATSLDGRLYHDGIIAKGVKEDGTENDVIVAAESYYNSRYNLAGSEDNLFDNTYIKFREISLSYQVPKSIYSKIGAQGLTLSLIGSNLFYIYKNLPNVSPEATLGTTGTNNFVEYTAYPNMRSFGFSIKARF